MAGMWASCKNRLLAVIVVLLIAAAVAGEVLYLRWAYYIRHLDRTQARSIAAELAYLERKASVPLKRKLDPGEVEALISRAVVERDREAPLRDERRRQVEAEAWQRVRPIFLRAAETGVLPGRCVLDVVPCPYRVERGKWREEVVLNIYGEGYGLTLLQLSDQPLSATAEEEP